MKKPIYRFRRRIAIHQIADVVGDEAGPRGAWDFRQMQNDLLEADCVVSAWSDGHLLGFAAASADSQTVSLTWLFVRRPHRRKGIGKQLILALLEKFPDCRRVDVIANSAAAGFYSKCGFEPAPYIGPMTKRLAR